MGVKTRLLASGKTEDNEFNISLLGFKVAVNEGLTVFNLVDGIVDEFHDESGTDESEGSNDTYCATSDLYRNFTTFCHSAGFSTTAITEPDTSTAGTNPSQGSGTFGTFTVPSGVTSITYSGWGAGGAGGATTSQNSGAGGFTTGNLAVTPGQTIYVGIAEGGKNNVAKPQSNGGSGFGFAAGGKVGQADPACGPGTRWGGGGGGGSGIGAAASRPQTTAPQVYFVSAGGGGASASCGASGAGGGPIGQAGGIPMGNPSYNGGMPAQNSASNSRGSLCSPGPHFSGGGGGDQEGGGAGGQGQGATGQAGSLLLGGDGGPTGGPPVGGGGGGGGYYGGGGGGRNTQSNFGGAGGGSAYLSHPQATCGSTTAGGPDPSSEAGATTNPLYVACTAEGVGNSGDAPGEDGYVFVTASGNSAVTSTTLVSSAFSANSIPTTSRIVVFEENVDTPTLNTDVIASVSRDGGSTYTTATLEDSGYVTGSSGQRILTGQATISGQPSGQSMRWKLALANNRVKIHGVSLQWS